VKPTPIVLGATGGAFTAVPAFAAEDLGYFKQEHLAPTFVTVPSGPAQVTALISGSVNFTEQDPNLLTLSYQKGYKVSIIAAAGGMVRLAAKLQCSNSSGITGTYPSVMKQLIGKPVGVTAIGSATYTYLVDTLEKAGVNYSSVDIVATGGGSTAAAAIESGAVDCTVAYEPLPELLAGKVHTIVNWEAGQGPAELAEHFTLFGNGVATAYAKAHPKVITEFAAALTKANAYIAKPSHASHLAHLILAQYPGFTYGELLGMIQAERPTIVDKITLADVVADNTIYDRLYAPSPPLTWPKSGLIDIPSS